MPHNIRLYSDVGAKMSMFDNKFKKHKENQMINPFSDWDGSGTRKKLSKDDPNYGKPLEGSRTAERGRQAQVQMISDMVELCDLIFDCGIKAPDGRGAISFGDVFRLYSAINDKCVGLLMRGRKHNILDFEGEMLFQRRDDDKMIELLLPLNTIRNKYGMPPRAGCGEVCPELVEELERQQKAKQPRARSLDRLEPPQPLQLKSRSMELGRSDAGGREETSWTLTVPPQNPTGRMGRSAENLTRIVDEEEQGAIGGEPDGAGVEGGSQGSSTNVSVGGGEEAGATALPRESGNTPGKEAASTQALPMDTHDGPTQTMESTGSDVAGMSQSERTLTNNEDKDATVTEGIHQSGITITVEDNKTDEVKGHPIYPEIKILVEEDQTEPNQTEVGETNRTETVVEYVGANETDPSALEATGEQETAVIANTDSCRHSISILPEPVANKENNHDSERDFWTTVERSSRSRSSSPKHNKRHSLENNNSRNSITDASVDASSEIQTHQESTQSFWEDIPSAGTREGIQDQQAEKTNDPAVDAESKCFSFWDNTEDESNSRTASEADATHENSSKTPLAYKTHGKDASGEDAISNKINTESLAHEHDETNEANEKKTFSFWDIQDEEALNETPSEASKAKDVAEDAAEETQPKDENPSSFWDVAEENIDERKASEQPKDEEHENTPQENHTMEDKPFSFWDVIERDESNEKGVHQASSPGNSIDRAQDEKLIKEEKPFSFWDVSKDGNTDGVPALHLVTEDMKSSKENTETKDESGSFWDVIKQDEDREKRENSCSRRSATPSSRRSSSHQTSRKTSKENTETKDESSSFWDVIGQDEERKKRENSCSRRSATPSSRRNSTHQTSRRSSKENTETKDESGSFWDVINQDEDREKRENSCSRRSATPSSRRNSSHQTSRKSSKENTETKDESGSFWDVIGQDEDRNKREDSCSRRSATPSSRRNSSHQTSRKSSKENTETKDESGSFWDVIGQDDDREKRENSCSRRSATPSSRRNSSRAQSPCMSDTTSHNYARPATPSSRRGSRRAESPCLSDEASDTHPRSATPSSRRDSSRAQSPCVPDEQSNDHPRPSTPSSRRGSSRAQSPRLSDAASHVHVSSSPRDFWDASSAEHPSTPGVTDADHLSQAPLTVPHITVSDEAEPNPAR